MHIIVNSGDYRKSYVDRINSLRKDEGCCDFRIKVGSLVLPVHKFVLIANVEYFRAMLRHETKESLEGAVEYEEFDADAVSKCIDFIYTGIVEIDDENLENILEFAELIHQTELLDGIIHNLQECLSIESWNITKRLATKFQYENLMKRCDEFALENFKEIVDKEDVDCEYLLFLLKNQKTFPQLDVFDVTLRWFNRNPEGRKDSVPKILGLIEFSRVPVEYLRHLIENEPLFKPPHSELMGAVMDNSDVESLDFSETKELNRDKGIVVFDRSSKCLQEYRPSTRKWRKMQSTQDLDEAIERNNFSSVSIGNTIYVLLRDKTVRKLSYLDKETNWKECASMKHDHGFPIPAIVHRGCIYVIGGNGRKCEKYDPQKNGWESIPSLSQGVLQNALAIVGDSIYSIGGLQNGAVVSTVQKFDTLTMNWSTIPSMQTPRCLATAVTVEDKIYVMGGYGKKIEDFYSVECYDPIQSNAWTTLTQMLTPRISFSSCVIGKDIYVLGGYGLTTTQRTIDIFSLEKNEWKMFDVTDVEIGDYGALLMSL